MPVSSSSFHERLPLSSDSAQLLYLPGADVAIELHLDSTCWIVAYRDVEEYNWTAIGACAWYRRGSHDCSVTSPVSLVSR